MSKNIDNEFTEQLFEAVLSLKDKEECFQFFRDIATVGEIVELGHRLEVAKMLKLGHTYNEIVNKTGVSTTTISRVKRSLEYGEDGYNLVLERMGYEDQE